MKVLTTNYPKLHLLLNPRIHGSHLFIVAQR